MSTGQNPVAEKVYADRLEIAREQNQRVADARRILGKAKAYGNWVLKDNLGIEPDVRVFCCQREGQGSWQPSADDSFPQLYDRREDKFYEVKGQRFYYFRYQLCFNALVLYNPRTPEQNVARMETLRANELAKEKASLPLFADQFET